ncbi:MAG TPA: UvrD-helicase domain-containing protein [Dehalococcoidia bacterium]|nr:UvrD-helicase domain-containing protein [Dehalococcoidia bacterium]
MTAAAFVPQDQRVRDEIRTRIDENMCVEAGAGTGKTSVLVDRIEQIIAAGRAPVDRIVAITFTEKAAAELAGRVRDRLEQRRACESDPEIRARVELALRDAGRAHIETIHAFAASLLRERPVEAMLDPGFRVLTDLPARLDFEEAYDEWMTEQIAQEPAPAALLDALNLGLGFEHVREAARALHDNRDMLPATPWAPQDVDVFALLRDIADQAEVIRRYKDDVLRDEDEAYKLALKALDLIAAFEALRGHEGSLRRAVASRRFAWSNRGSQPNWRSAESCRQVKGATKRIAELVAGCASAMKQNATAALVIWLEGFVAWYEARRRAAGTADFDDLLIWARGLVRDNAEVRRYFASKFSAILVDEFQDTDPLQAELVVLLCAEEDQAVEWRRMRLRPGSLFVVGDPKQSIYRFRRADIATYDDVVQHLFGGRPRALVQNFRSREPIVAWVNDTFDALFAHEPGVQPRYAPLVVQPEFAAARPEALTVIRGEVELREGAKRAPALREAEANALAALIARAVGQREWTLRDGEPATWRDIAVLIPSRADLATYEDAFARAGIPWRHDGARTFFLRQEVRDCVAVLRAIDDPADAVAAVAALRSSAFGLSDEDLLLHVAGGGRFDSTRLRDDAAGPVPDALRRLRDFASIRHETPLPEFVRRVIDETRLVEMAMLQHNGEQAAANLLKLIDQARVFTASGGGLRAFVRWLRENVARTYDFSGGSEETDAPISEETDDVVRVLTVHAAKGLEFPVVVFANMGTERADRTRVIADRTARRVEVRVGRANDGFRTPGFDAAMEHERLHDDAEQVRLLYVAATRARDRLVVPMLSVARAASANGRGGDRTKPTWNDRLRDGAPPADDVAIDAASLPAFGAEVPALRVDPDAPPTDAVAQALAAREAWIDARQSLLAAAAKPLRVLTATDLKDPHEFEDAQSDLRRGRATDFGVAVHALLERADLSRADDAERLAPAIAREHGLLGREREIAEVAARAMRSDAVARALAAPRCLREVPFAVSAGNGALAEGRIDLLFEEDGALVVVDFKTDAVSRAEVQTRAAAYDAQAKTYAWAAARAAALPVREVVFVFARPGVEHRVPVDAAFRAAAEELIATASR